MTSLIDPDNFLTFHHSYLIFYIKIIGAYAGQGYTKKRNPIYQSVKFLMSTLFFRHYKEKMCMTKKKITYAYSHHIPPKKLRMPKEKIT